MGATLIHVGLFLVFMLIGFCFLVGVNAIHREWIASFNRNSTGIPR